MAGPIDVNLAAQKYGTNTPAAAGVWQQKAAASAQVWEAAAKSQEAETRWAERTTEAIARQGRLQGLQSVTAGDYAAGVQAGGQNYANKVAAAGPKWAAKFAPYATVINTIVPSLPPKTGDVTQNVMNRVAPIANALRQAKIGGAVGRTLGTPSPFGAAVRRY